MIMPHNLLPCPFCGSNVFVHTGTDHLAGNGYHEIYCDECDFSMTEGFIMNQYVADNRRESEQNARNRLLAKWNKRNKGTPN